jgi:ribosomal protein L15
VETLLKAKIVDKADVKDGLKILASGEISKKLTISAEILLSQTAKDAIIKAGGKILELGN